MVNVLEIKGKSRNAERTRGAILEAATGIFADKGYNGTPLSEIVEKSGFNKRMIYHYFGDKLGLYRAVSADQWNELKLDLEAALQKRIEESRGKSPSTRQLIEDAVEIAFDFMATHQDFLRLLLWDSLEGGEISRSLWTDVRGPLFVQIEFLLNQAKKEGVLKKEVDPAQLVVTFLGAIGMYFAYASSMGDLLRADPMSPESIARRKAHLTQLLRFTLTDSP